MGDGPPGRALAGVPGGTAPLGELLSARERHAEAAEAYHKAIAHYGLLEEAHRGLMQSQAALGERGRALRHYEELVELLDEQLGTAPAPETSALHESLRVLADRSARRWILAEMIAFFAWGAHLAFTGAFLAERHGVAESATGILLALGAAAFFVTSVRGAPLLGRLPRPRLVAAAALVIGVLIALQFNTHAAVWIALVAWFCAPPQAGSEPPSFLCWGWLSSRTSPAR